MRPNTADLHDLGAAERFLAAEARIAATFGRIEEAVAPLLRAMRARDRTTYATDPERGAIWGYAYLRPPYAPDAAAEWFVTWGLRFPDGGSGWDAAVPPLPHRVHAVVALGADGEPAPRPRSLPRGRLPEGWSVMDGGGSGGGGGGGAAGIFLAAALPVDRLPTDPDGMTDALAGWVLARLADLRPVLSDLAAG